MRTSVRFAALASMVLVCAFTCTTTSKTANNTQVPPSSSLLPTPTPSPTAASTPASITGIPMPGGEVGIAYTTTLTASGGSTPYTWSLDSGNQPPGLTLGTDGTVSGTPAAAGTFSFNVKATDSQAQYTTQGASVKVFAPLKVLTQPCASSCVIGAGCQKCGGFATVGQGAPPYSYRINGGAVPPGMRFTGLGLSGPFPAGNWSMSVLVADSLGAQVTILANWAIYSPAVLVSGGDCIAVNNNVPGPTCSVRWTYSRGNPTTAPQAIVLGYGQNCIPGRVCPPAPTAPPPGWSVTVRGGVVQIAAGPILCGAPNYIGAISLALVDRTVCATTGRSNTVVLKVDLENTC